MQYLVSVIDDKTGSATPDEMVAIDAFNDRLAKTISAAAGGSRCSPVAVGELRRHPGERSGHIVPFCIQPDSVPRVLSMAAWINGGLDR
jgi:hypothetical protein